MMLVRDSNGSKFQLSDLTYVYSEDDIQWDAFSDGYPPYTTITGVEICDRMTAQKLARIEKVKANRQKRIDDLMSVEKWKELTEKSLAAALGMRPLGDSEKELLSKYQHDQIEIINSAQIEIDKLEKENVEG